MYGPADLRLSSRKIAQANVLVQCWGRAAGGYPTGWGAVHVYFKAVAGNAAGQPAAAVAEDPGGSDQVSFAEAGIPAVQLFSGPHEDYHRPSDTPEKLDYQGLSRIAALTRELLQRLASGPGLTPTGSSAVGKEPRVVRKVSLGAIPDFVFGGEGARLSGVSSGSPAEKAGLRAGDVIVALGGMPVKSFKDFSKRLNEFRPGERVAVGYLRENRLEEIFATLLER